MLDATESNKTEDARILLDLLNSVERDGGQSQRRLASELGIALGLVNAYLRRSVKKGLLKATAAPARRYIYYLTPQGFAEKSRLTVEYLSVSFSFFRRAKAECGVLFSTAADRGFHRVALAGISDLAEIAMICALDTGVKVTAVVDANSTLSRFIGVQVVPSFDAIVGSCDAVLITDLQRTAELTEQASALFGIRACAYAKIDPTTASHSDRRGRMTEELMTGSTWHVVQVHPHAELKAQMHLVRQGFATYLPRYLKRRRHARRTEIVPAPLYPSYLFVSFNHAIHRWRSIHSTVGVSRLVCNGESPAAVDSGMIDGLKSRENEQGYIQLERRSQFAAGDKVRVREGVFCDCLGLFESLSDRERVAILLELLGRKVRVVLDEVFVVAA